MAFSKDFVSLEEEMNRYQKDFQSLNRSHPKFDHSQKKFLQAFKNLELLKHSLSKSEINDHKTEIIAPPLEVVQNALDKYLRLYSYDLPVLDPDIYPPSVYKVFENIELSSEQWSDSEWSEGKFIQLSLNGGQNIPSVIWPAENHHYFLEFSDQHSKDNLLGEGSFKEVRKVFSYDDEAWFARATFKNSSDKKRLEKNKAYLNEEMNFLRRVNSLPDEKTKGLMKAHAFGSDAIYFPLMQGDLFNLTDFEDPLEPAELQLSEDEQFSILNQVAVGVRNLHEELNFIHSDIKLENILISSSENDLHQRELRAYLTDFGLSWNLIKVHLKQEIYFRGSLSWMAPEALASQLIGKSTGEKVENAKKLDVYSLGHLAASIFDYQNYLPWEFQCDTWLNLGRAPNLQELAQYRQCQSASAKSFREKMMAKSTMDLKGQFILWAMQSNVELRPSDKQFIQALGLLERIRKLNRNTELEPSYLGVQTDRFHEKEEENYPPSYRINRNQAFHLLKNQKPGNYIVRLASNKTQNQSLHQSAFELFYLDQTEKIRMKRLESNPHCPSHLKEELKFLKMIHFIYD